MKKILVANWKVHHNLASAQAFALELLGSLGKIQEVDVYLSPQFPLIHPLLSILTPHVGIIAQNSAFIDFGAYTGEVSPSLLNQMGVSGTIIGHSERREYFNEANQVLEKKLMLALEKGLKVIYCFGESALVRKKGQHLSFIEEQISSVLKPNQIKQFCDQIIMAYEPVWSIGTNMLPSSDEISEVHVFVKEWVRQQFGIEVELPVLYGGSLNSESCQRIFSVEGVDGGLVGGASLALDTFYPILKALANK